MAREGEDMAGRVPEYDSPSTAGSVGGRSPYVLAYDLCILTMAAAFLVKDGLQRGFLAGERLGLVACWAAGVITTAPIGPIICLVFLFLIVRRMRVSDSHASGEVCPA